MESNVILKALSFPCSLFRPARTVAWLRGAHGRCFREKRGEDGEREE